MDDVARAERLGRVVDGRFTVAAEPDHDLGVLLLHVRADAPSGIELAGEDRGERGSPATSEQVPDRDRAIAAEEPLAPIASPSFEPHPARVRDSCRSGRLVLTSAAREA